MSLYEGRPLYCSPDYYRYIKLVCGSVTLRLLLALKNFSFLEGLREVERSAIPSILNVSG